MVSRPEKELKPRQCDSGVLLKHLACTAWVFLTTAELTHQSAWGCLALYCFYVREK